MFRSILFVPATRPDRFQKALEAGADAVCIDLEDAVPPDKKQEARNIIASFPIGSRNDVAQCLRINALTTKDGILDLAALAEADARPDFLILPKVTAAIELAIVESVISDDIPVLAVIESTTGLDAVHDIAAHPATRALMFGSADYSAEIGSTMGWDALLYARSKIIAAAAANGKKALDGIWPDIQDNVGLVDDTRRMKAIGFHGRVAIHPKQIRGIHIGFLPTDTELTMARKIVKAFDDAGRNAIQVNGKMVDQPIYDAAISLLKRNIEITCQTEAKSGCSSNQ